MVAARLHSNTAERSRVVVSQHSMVIFIAGATGAIGRLLVPLLVTAGHEVVALTRAPDSVRLLERMGAVPVVGNVYDDVRLARSIAQSRAEVVIHQLTAFGTKDGDPAKMHPWTKDAAFWLKQQGFAK